MGCDSYSDEVGDCHGTCSNKLLCDLILGSILFLLLDTVVPIVDYWIEISNCFT